MKKFFARFTTLAVALAMQTQGWTVCTPPGILMPSGVTVAPGAAINLPVVLGMAAPAGGVSIMLTSSNPSAATVSPSSFLISAGMTAPLVSVIVSGLSAGSATITASATGLSNAATVVTVTGSTGSGSIILPSIASVIAGSTVNFPLKLAAAAPPGGVTVTLASSNTSVLPVTPATVQFAAGSMTPATAPQIFGFLLGSATITASGPGLGSASESIQVTESGLSVTWEGACLVDTTIYGISGEFQAIAYTLNSPVPITLNGTLFFTANCDPSAGQDNMNDYQTSTNPGSGVQGFSHHPNQFPSSAVYWFGTRTSDGMCAPGAPCSGCVNYTASTPGC